MLFLLGSAGCQPTVVGGSPTIILKKVPAESGEQRGKTPASPTRGFSG